MSKLVDLTGKIFGKLTVVSRASNDKQGRVMWNCVCDCGNEKTKTVRSYDLISGRVSSCGCLRIGKKNAEVHGKRATRLYRIWTGMKQRCNNAKSPSYNLYGGENKIICHEWVNDFTVFYDWAMANGYADNLTIERIDNTKGYTPSNCKWATYKEQENNRRNNRYIEYHEKKYTISQLAEKLNMNPATLNWRLKNGWDESELCMTPALNNRIKRGRKKHG